MATKGRFNHSSIEAKWQEVWSKEKTFIPDIKQAKNPFYNLWMFPYPSAEGLHAGHAYASTGSDIYGKFMRMQGKDVFQPIGYDSFGIHSENYALKVGENPANIVPKTTRNYEGQLKSLGHGYDWTRTVTTSDIDYYRWTQWLFVQLFKAGLAYRKAARVNWCPSCKTVLADEQVIAGKCERCSTEVEKKDVEQWFFRITSYADRLLNNLSKIDWPEKIKLIQKNWIGRSKGAQIFFRLKGSGENVEVFTTRPDTLFGATFLVLSPESPWLKKVVTKENLSKVSEYIEKSQSSNLKAQISANKQKTGVFTGAYAINPATEEEIPIWVADYVLSEYGSGAIMGVPSHDERDKEFAVSHKLEKRQIVPDGKLWEIVPEKNWGKPAITFHLRDWLISRQRYWGPPIPMIFCGRCKDKKQGWLTENKPKLCHDQSDWDFFGWWPEEKLPIQLPHIEDYTPIGMGRGPLSNHPEFYETVCPHCGSKAVRETDVSDTFLDSSWYFLRYPSVGVDSQPWDLEITKKWLPVDLYFGGAEHAVLHLLYARFMTMVLHDLGKLDFEEPFPRFFAHGLMIKDGAKMSKSKGNVVNPDVYIEKFGADALRLYLMFIGPMDGSPDFRDTGMEGMKRFVDRLWQLFTVKKDVVLSDKKDSKEILNKMHQTIKKVTEDIENFRYNVAISGVMEFVNLLEDKSKLIPGSKSLAPKMRCAEWDEALRNLALLLAPFAPHMTEEVWHMMENKSSIHKALWPRFDTDLAREEKLVIIVQVNSRVRSELKVSLAEAQNQDKIENLAKENSNVAKWLQGKKIKKSVFVPERLINFVI